LKKRYQDKKIQKRRNLKLKELNEKPQSWHTLEGQGELGVTPDE